VKRSPICPMGMIMADENGRNSWKVTDGSHGCYEMMAMNNIRLAV
jgi:hypothetical protein